MDYGSRYFGPLARILQIFSFYMTWPEGLFLNGELWQKQSGVWL